MKNVTSTAAVIGSIAVAIALAFLAPKGFQLGDPAPIVTAEEIAAIDAQAAE